MWVLVIGGYGTCKESVIEYMSKKYEYSKDAPVTGASIFEQQIGYLIARHNTAIKCHSESKTKKVASIRGFWDTHLVFTQFYRKIGLLTDEEYFILDKIYKGLFETTPSPDYIIYLKNTVIGSSCRVDMNKGVSVPNENIDLLSKLYEQYASMIRIPILDINVDRDIVDVCEEINTGLPDRKFIGNLFPTRIL